MSTAGRIAAVERRYTYFYKPSVGKGWWVSATRSEWLEALLLGRASPKPPPSWVRQQEAQGRSATQAGIIWGRHYDAGRKYAIWDQSSEDDFREVGYLYE